MRPDPLLLIGGTERSGTTLIRNMLDAHPLVALPGESYFMIEVASALNTMGSWGDLPLAWKLISSHRMWADWGLPTDAVAAEVARAPVETYPELIRALWTAYAKWRNKPHCADKTPAHVHIFPKLAEMFPTARMVRVFRDPRSAAMSLSVQHFSTGGLGDAASWWTTTMRAGRKARESLGPDVVLDVRYEDLIDDPRVEMERICEHAGLPFADEVLDPFHAEGLKGDHHSRSRLHVMTDPRPWQREMSKAEIALIEGIAGEEMTEAGYRRVCGKRTLMRGLPGYAKLRLRYYLTGRVRRRWGFEHLRLPPDLNRRADVPLTVEVIR